MYPVVQFLERRLGSLKHFKKKGKSTRGPAVALTAVMVALVLILGLILLKEMAKDKELREEALS